MSVSLSIILDALKDFSPESHLPSGFNPSFRFCLPMAETDSVLPDHCLYIASLSDALKAETDKDSTVMICLRDRDADAAEIAASGNNIIIINDPVSRECLTQVIQRRFYSVADWEYRLHDALLHECTMQDLVDLCPPFLVNHIQITDASFMKLAQSTTIDCDCPICVALKKYGYHPEETVEKFRSHNLFDVWARKEEIYLDPETVVAKYPTVHKIFKFHGSYYAHVVMTCCNAVPDQAMLDLFRIFIDALSICVERDWETKMSCVHPYDRVFQDLLQENITDPQQLKNRALRTELPIEGNFYLIQIVRAKEQNVPFGTMMKEFSELFPRFRFINYEDSIVGFIHSTPNTPLRLNESMVGMEEFLEKYDSYCGISSQFTNLINAHSHYIQAKMALKNANAIRNNKSPLKLSRSVLDTDTRLCPFDLYFPFTFFGIDQDTKKIWQNSIYYNLLYKLYQNDVQRGTDDLYLLFVYLTHERRSTEAAAILNMHRNSIIYRVNRIEEFLDIDLNDEITRIMLFMAFLPVIAYGFS